MSCWLLHGELALGKVSSKSSSKTQGSDGSDGGLGSGRLGLSLAVVVGVVIRVRGAVVGGGGRSAVAALELGLTKVEGELLAPEGEVLEIAGAVAVVELDGDGLARGLLSDLLGVDAEALTHVLDLRAPPVQGRGRGILECVVSDADLVLSHDLHIALEAGVESLDHARGANLSREGGGGEGEEGSNEGGGGGLHFDGCLFGCSGK